MATASLALIGCLCLLTSGLHFASSSTLKCYVCNSEDEPACGEQLPPPEMLVDCSIGRQVGAKFVKPVNNATVCWSQYQEVEGDDIVVRNCGNATSSEGRDDIVDAGSRRVCYERVGTKKVRVEYCRCNYDGCNAAGGHAATAAVVTVAAAAAAWLTIA